MLEKSCWGRESTEQNQNTGADIAIGTERKCKCSRQHSRVLNSHEELSRASLLLLFLEVDWTEKNKVPREETVKGKPSHNPLAYFKAVPPSGPPAQTFECHQLPKTKTSVSQLKVATSPVSSLAAFVGFIRERTRNA